MKKLFKSMAVMAAILSLGLTGCVSEGNENGGKSKEGKKTTVQLRVLTSGASTRAAGGDERDTEGNEAVLDDDVYVLVYKASGELEYFHKHILTDDNGDKKTSAFQITTGDKYFYVVSDPHDVFEARDHTKDDLLAMGLDRDAYERVPCWGNISESKIAGIADPTHSTHGFLNSTLWSVKQTVTSATETVDVEVGRFAAKVTLNEKPSGFTTKMGGVWSDFRFTIGAIPDAMRMVGSYAGTIVPPAAGHGRVKSLFHEIPSEGGTVLNVAGDESNIYYVNFPTQYSSLKEPYTAENMSCYYIHENTSAKMKSDGTVSTDGSLYYGNTTYVLFAATYTPADTEWHNYLDASDAGVANKHIDGKSFYTAKVNGQTLVFGESPVSTMEGLDESSIRFYENGVNYFHFPIRDRKETALEDQCRVLRNHWYDITVNSIDRFGDTNTTVTPSEPVDEEIELDVLIKVLKWASVSQSENL